MYKQGFSARGVPQEDAVPGGCARAAAGTRWPAVSVCLCVCRTVRRRSTTTPTATTCASFRFLSPVVDTAAAAVLSLSSPLETLLLVITESSPLRCLQRYRSYIILILYMHSLFRPLCVCFFFVHHSTRALADLRYAYNLVNNIILYNIHTYRNVDQTTEFSETSTLRVLRYDDRHHLRSTCLVFRRSDGRLRV